MKTPMNKKLKHFLSEVNEKVACHIYIEIQKINGIKTEQEEGGEMLFSIHFDGGVAIDDVGSSLLTLPCTLSRNITMEYDQDHDTDELHDRVSLLIGDDRNEFSGYMSENIKDLMNETFSHLINGEESNV